MYRKTDQLQYYIVSIDGDTKTTNNTLPASNTFPKLATALPKLATATTIDGVDDL